MVAALGVAVLARMALALRRGLREVDAQIEFLRSLDDEGDDR